VTYLGLWYLILWIGLSILSLSHASWGAALAANYHERSRIYGWMTAMAPIGSVSLLLLPILTGHKLTLGDPKSFHDISLIIVFGIPIGATIMLLFTPERPKVTASHQKFGFMDYVAMMRRPTMAKLIMADLAYTLGPGVTGPLYAFFFGQIKGFDRAEIGFLLIFYIGAALAGGFAWPMIAKRISKHRAIQVASVAYAIAQTSLMATPRELFWPTAIGMLFVGFCVSAFILLIRSMVADYADEMQLEQGRERAGVLYAMVTTTQKLGASINVLLVFPILQFIFKFDPKKPVNDAFALQGCSSATCLRRSFSCWSGPPCSSATSWTKPGTRRSAQRWTPARPPRAMRFLRRLNRSDQVRASAIVLKALADRLSGVTATTGLPSSQA